MRFPVDENFPKSLLPILLEGDNNLVWARSDLPRWKDVDLLELAESESRIMLTLDKDLVQIASQRREPLKHSGVVLFRVHPANPATLEPLVRRFLSAQNALAGNIIVVTPERIEILPARRK